MKKYLKCAIKSVIIAKTKSTTKTKLSDKNDIDDSSTVNTREYYVAPRQYSFKYRHTPVRSIVQEDAVQSSKD